MGDRRTNELTPDQMVLVIVGVVVVGAGLARGQQLLAAAGDWLRRHQILTTDPGGLAIPQLGSLDAPRLLILGGIVIIAAVLVRVTRRSVLRPRREAARR